MYNNINYPNNNYGHHGHYPGSPASSVPPPQSSQPHQPQQPPQLPPQPQQMQYIPGGYYYQTPQGQAYVYPPPPPPPPPPGNQTTGLQQPQIQQTPPGSAQSTHQSQPNVGSSSKSGTTSAGSKRGPWSPLEDKKLLDLISIFGPTNWVRISNSLTTRTPKQCRERFHQNLKPSLNRAPITVEEGEMIERLVAKYGKKWAEISKHMNGRSDNAIKNWWNGGANRRRRASATNGRASSSSTNTTNPNTAEESHEEASETSNDEKSRNASISTKSEGEPLVRNASTTSVNSMTKPNLGPSPNVPSQYPQVPHLPQISFNTSMFGKSENFRPSSPQTLPALAPANASPYKASSAFASRSASFDINAKTSGTTLPPISSTNKRRLLDDPISRRHSTANSTVYPHHQPSSLTSSHPNLSAVLLSGSGSGPGSVASSQGQPGNLTPPYYGSPLLLSTQASRNNSISFDFTGLNSTSSSSRRSSNIAPDLFPNPLKDASGAHGSHKRNISHNSSFNSPCLTPASRFSVSSNTSSLNPAVSGAKEEELVHKKAQEQNLQNPQDADEKPEKTSKTKISVSSLIS